MLMPIEGPGMTSHQAEYDGLPDAETSCSVPVWISVLSVTVHVASTQPPPIPIQSEEAADWPVVCWLAAGTVQSPLIEWNCFTPPCSRVPWLYPNQLLLWFAFTRCPDLATWMSCPWARGAAVACAARPAKSTEAAPAAASILA